MDLDLEFHLDPGRVVAAWMLGAFVLVFAVTRTITRLIRAGRGPFRDTTVGGVHVHHLVYGIALMLLAGAGEFTYRPTGAWQLVLAVAFGSGAALTLDEFALWLRLADVYWSEEGRLSVDAVLVVGVVGVLLVLGANPFDTDPADAGAEVALVALVGAALAVVAALKGKPATALIGVFLLPVAVAGAVRLARPGSFWARRRYRPGSSRDARARARYPEGGRTRWDGLVDAVGGVPRDIGPRRGTGPRPSPGDGGSSTP